MVGGSTIPQACQKLGISEATFHRWRKRYNNGQENLSDDGPPPLRGGKEDLVRCVKALEKENKRLKQLVGQLMLDNAFLKDALDAKHRR